MGFRRPPLLTRVPYAAVRAQLLDPAAAVVAVFTGAGPVPQLIRRATRSDYSHVGMIVPVNGVVMLAEADRPASRCVAFSLTLRFLKGEVDLFRVARDHDPALARGFMLRAAGADYPEQWLVNNWLRIHFGERVDPVPNSDDPETPRHCSGLVHAALRAAGMAAIKPHDCDVFPDMFAAPGWTEYLCTPRSDQKGA